MKMHKNLWLENGLTKTSHNNFNHNNMELQEKMKKAIKDNEYDFMAEYDRNIIAKECTKIALQAQIDLLRLLSDDTVLATEYTNKEKKEYTVGYKIKQLEQQLKSLDNG